MKSYQFYAFDYLRDTAHLNELEDLIYRRLLDWYHLNECALPEPMNACAKIAGINPSDENRMLCVRKVVKEFFYLVDGFGWQNERANESVERYQQWRKNMNQKPQTHHANAKAEAWRAQTTDSHAAQQEPHTVH